MTTLERAARRHTPILALGAFELGRTGHPARPASAWPWLWLIGLWAVVTAYNLFKPFHIDDTAHVEIARWIAAHPLHPMSGILNWDGADELIAKTNQPHLYFYLLALWGSLFGFSEVGLHALQALFALTAILLMYRLADALIPRVALWATTIVILGPAFVVEQNLMVDVPLLAVWLAFFNLVLLGPESAHQGRRFGLAAVACSAAMLIKYSSLVLFPVLVLVILTERRWRQAWVLLIPIAVLGAWSAFNVYDYGHVHILNRDAAASPSDRLRPARHAAAWLMGLGALSPLGVLFAFRLARASERRERIVGLALAGLFLLLVFASAGRLLPDTISDKLLWIGFVGNGGLIGLGVMVAILWVFRRRLWALPRSVEALAVPYLLVWIVATSLFYVLFAPFMAPRHILLILPALTLLLSSWNAGPSQTARIFAFGMTAVISAGLCVADWNFASFYRMEASALAANLPQTGRKWTIGHWGWQWYAERAGFTEMDLLASPLAPGDVIAVTKDTNIATLKRPVAVSLRSVEPENNQGINPFCTGRAIRFYLFGYSAPPWTLSPHCGGQVDVYDVTGTSAPAGK